MSMAAKTFILLTVIVGLVSAEDSYYPGHEFHRTQLGNAVDGASFKLFKELYQEADDKNLIASPLGVLTLLSLYAAGAGGDNRDEIMRALGAYNYTLVSDAYKSFNRELSEMDPDFLTLANKIYVSDDYTLAQGFRDIVQDYKSEVEKISFLNPVVATATINQWAEQKTKGHLKNPVPENAIDSNSAAALFNIIFFQGHWAVPFNSSETKDEDFHVNKSTVVKKPTMHLQQSLFYYESKDLGAKLVELPYKEMHFRMVVVLPNEVDGLPSLIENVSKQGLLADVFALEPSGVDVDLYMPKFDMKTSLDLNLLLPKVGVSRIFTDPAHGIVKERGVFVSKAFQKAFVKVDEEGATAGAFTGLVLVPESLDYETPRPLELRIDHPFLFLILYEDKIIFVGTYTN